MENKTWFIVPILAILAVAAGYFLYSAWFLRQELQIARQDIEALASELAVKNVRLAELDGSLKKTVEAKSQLEQAAVKADDTIGELTRLARTDKELLQKYSKIFFLNENYQPAELSAIDTRYLYDRSKPQQIHDRVSPYLKEMIDTASNVGINLQVISGYRSFGTQASLKTGYKVTYGSGANKFSADQGYSEHQLGTTVDLGVPGLAPTTSAFADNQAYEWLNNNVHRFGFILSYPKGNSYYVFEPWHWRFVGVELATYLHNNKKTFYDLDQREIDSYLIKIFN